MLLLGFKLSCGKSVKYRYIEFFAFDYDSLPISFQSGIAVSFSSSIKYILENIFRVWIENLPLWYQLLIIVYA